MLRNAIVSVDSIFLWAWWGHLSQFSLLQKTKDKLISVLLIIKTNRFYKIAFPAETNIWHFYLVQLQFICFFLFSHVVSIVGHLSPHCYSICSRQSWTVYCVFFMLLLFAYIVHDVCREHAYMFVQYNISHCFMLFQLLFQMCARTCQHKKVERTKIAN